ncbi:ORF6N domain-containing protein [Mordavella massiliensis]|uniref:ORF6N domain-containing protein n=1 Tax=Mordavella massiliensis TaxID=1871024 RepID=UPI00210A447F|nr:ORF6N domain-containing protein [Mordavella massiliensis]
MQLQLMKVVEIKGQRVLTTEQIAKYYNVSPKIIQYNFSHNKQRYMEGKHFISLQGAELKQFKANFEIQGNLKYARILSLWTERGALLHAKSLNTDKAWEAYDYLLDFYFRAKDEKKVSVTVENKPVLIQEKNRQELPQIDNPIQGLKVAEDKGIKVNSFPLDTVDSMLKDNHIVVRTQVTVEKACYEVAWELSHAFIHYQKGDLIKSLLSKDYNEQATRAADMVMKILNVKMSQM